MNTDQNPITFSVYTGSAVSKGQAVRPADIWGSGHPGIGVFGFYQRAVNGVKTMYNSTKLSLPDYMYNQQVTSTDGSTWSYKPVKFWPNNVGDQLSFFAYAPYDDTKTWNEMSISTDTQANKLTVGFIVIDDADKQKDILWAEPQINKTNKLDGNINDLSNNLSFRFKHITSKVEIMVGVAKPNYVVAGPWTDDKTSIILENIVFNDLYNGFYFVYPIKTDGSLDTPSVEYKNVGTYNLKVVPAPAVSVIDDKWNPNPSAKDYTKYYDYYMGSGKYLFLTPQTFKNETVTVTYKVKTKVNGINGIDDPNDSVIKNEVTKKLSDIISELKLGEAYCLKFLIGMDDVNVDAQLTDWSSVTTQTTNVPTNQEP